MEGEKEHGKRTYNISEICIKLKYRLQVKRKMCYNKTHQGDIL